MGVLDKARDLSRRGKSKRRPYVCVTCETAFEVQYHACPACGGYDVRRTEWVGD
ncbi:hypothetical protein [Halomicrobium urmianum]|uniref:hypothetical protein n=1 Tax=Halomicrobium urmianum TaxID=1586233 RepID=UPI001CD998F6|nr:hypothetical protein [Halomicrobium urmianum]